MQPMSLVPYAQRGITTYPDRALVRDDVANMHRVVTDTLHTYYSVEKKDVYMIVNKWVLKGVFGHYKKELVELWGVPKKADLTDHMETWQLIGKLVCLYFIQRHLEKDLATMTEERKRIAIRIVRQLADDFAIRAKYNGIDFSKKDTEIHPLIFSNFIATYIESMTQETAA
jgi:hypothetical protein